MDFSITLQEKLSDAKKDMRQVLANVSELSVYEKTLIIRNTNVATDKEYQKNFTYYYKLRRDADWLAKYYAFMEENKHNTNLKFKDIITYLSAIPHKVKKSTAHPDGYAKTADASFSSKMLATINPNYPIWDSQVAQFFSVSIPTYLPLEEKISKCIEIYDKLSLAIGDFINTEKGHEYIEKFDCLFPKYSKFSPYKKIDFYLWNLGKPESETITD